MAVARGLCLLGLGLLATANATSAQEAVEAEIRKRVPLVQRWARDPVVVAAIVRANARQSGIETIRDRDRVWQATSGIDAFMQGLLDNERAHRLRELAESTPELGEAFVTDALGANVAMTQKTSDFWQGDEDKFTRAFISRADAYHVDPVSFDESIQAYAVQISVPILSGASAIGVLVVTINLERIVGLQ